MATSAGTLPFAIILRMTDLAVQLLPLALLVGVVARELFRRATPLRRVVLAALATLAISLWIHRPLHPQEILVPGALYFGFVAGLLWDPLRRR